MPQSIGCKEDEIFVGNVELNNGHKDLTYLKDIKCRLGDQALDIHGKKINNGYMLPLFIKKSDEIKYDRIMMARLKNV